jgi:hypothetical protein
VVHIFEQIRRRTFARGSRSSWFRAFGRFGQCIDKFARGECLFYGSGSIDGCCNVREVMAAAHGGESIFWISY